MSYVQKMPKLSPTMEEGTIAKWHKKEGDYVKAGELLFEVATDKATIEFNVLDAGYLRKILIPQGKSGRVNDPVALFTDSADESIEDLLPKPVESKREEKKSEEPAAAQPAVSKAAAGPALQEPAFTPEPPLAGYQFPFGAEPVQGRILASPLARKLAKEQGLDLHSVKGSGPNHRIMSRDLPLAQKSAAVSFGDSKASAVAPGTYEEEPLTPMRKIVAKRLQESKTYIPHFYVTQEIVVDALVNAYEQLKSQGIKLTYNDFVVRAAALSLRSHPEVNSGFNSVAQTIIRFKTVDISLAVTLPGGLITPILRLADYKNLGEINVEVKELARRAREGSLSREEYVGGSFTISNLGMFGISEFAAIINPPQAALLAVGGIQEKAIVKNGVVVPGKTLSVTLSCDHRVIDGAEGAKFLQTFKNLLENPYLLLI